MKNIICSLLLFISIACSGQEAAIKATREHWANGACCAHGTNYQLFLNADKTVFEKLCIDSVVIDNRMYKDVYAGMQQIKTGESMQLLVSFNYYFNEFNKLNIYEPNIDIVNKPNTIYYRIEKQIYAIEIKNVEDLPIIPYP